MGRCVLPNLSAKTHIAVLPGRGRAGAPGQGPTSGASGVRRAVTLSRALRRRTRAPSRYIYQRIYGVLRRCRRRVACEIWARHLLDWVVDPELVKEVVENYAIGVEGGARVEALGLPPGEELLDVLGRDKPGVGFGCHMFGKKFEDVFVFLVGEGLAERLDVFEERLDGFLQRQRFVFFIEAGEFEAAVFGVEF